MKYWSWWMHNKQREMYLAPQNPLNSTLTLLTISTCIMSYLLIGLNYIISQGEHFACCTVYVMPGSCRGEGRMKLVYVLVWCCTVLRCQWFWCLGQCTRIRTDYFLFKFTSTSHRKVEGIFMVWELEHLNIKKFMFHGVENNKINK